MPKFAVVEYLLRRGIVDPMAVYYFGKHAAKHYGICSAFLAGCQGDEMSTNYTYSPSLL